MSTDPVQAHPDLYRVLLENDRVRVLRYEDAPGDRTSPHVHPDSVMITLSDFERRLGQDGQERDVRFGPGEVRWLDAQQHAGENIGQTPTVTIFVELKEHRPTPDPEHPVLPALGPSEDPGATGSRPPASLLEREVPEPDVHERELEEQERPDAV